MRRGRPSRDRPPRARRRCVVPEPMGQQVYEQRAGPAGRRRARRGVVRRPDRGADPPLTSAGYRPGALAPPDRRRPRSSGTPAGRRPLPRPRPGAPVRPPAAARPGARGPHRPRRGALALPRRGHAPLRRRRPRPGARRSSSARRSSRPTRWPRQLGVPGAGRHPERRRPRVLRRGAAVGGGARPLRASGRPSCSMRAGARGARTSRAWPVPGRSFRSARSDATLVLVGPRDDRRDRLFGPLDGTVRTGRVDGADGPGPDGRRGGRRRPLPLRGLRAPRARGDGRRRAGGRRAPGARSPRCAATRRSWSSPTPKALAEGLSRPCSTAATDTDARIERGSTCGPKGSPGRRARRRTPTLWRSPRRDEGGDRGARDRPDRGDRDPVVAGRPRARPRGDTGSTCSMSSPVPSSPTTGVLPLGHPGAAGGLLVRRRVAGTGSRTAVELVPAVCGRRPPPARRALRQPRLLDRVGRVPASRLGDARAGRLPPPRAHRPRAAKRIACLNRHVDRFVVISHFVADQWLASGLDPAKVERRPQRDRPGRVPRGRPARARARHDASSVLPEDAFVVSYVGRLDREKGVDVVLARLAPPRPLPRGRSAARGRLVHGAATTTTAYRAELEALGRTRCRLPAGSRRRGRPTARRRRGRRALDLGRAVRADGDRGALDRTAGPRLRGSGGIPEVLNGPMARFLFERGDAEGLAGQLVRVRAAGATTSRSSPKPAGRGCSGTSPSPAMVDGVESAFAVGALSTPSEADGDRRVQPTRRRAGRSAMPPR